MWVFFSQLGVMDGELKSQINTTSSQQSTDPKKLFRGTLPIPDFPELNFFTHAIWYYVHLNAIIFSQFLPDSQMIFPSEAYSNFMLRPPVCIDYRSPILGMDRAAGHI